RQFVVILRTACMQGNIMSEHIYPFAASEANWLVKRETSEQTPNSQEGKCAGRQTSREQRLRREWGGEATLQTYCTAGMAKILLKRLGSDLREFLSLAENADLRQVIDHLQATVRTESAVPLMERRSITTSRRCPS